MGAISRDSQLPWSQELYGRLALRSKDAHLVRLLNTLSVTDDLRWSTRLLILTFGAGRTTVYLTYGVEPSALVACLQYLRDVASNTRDEGGG